MAVVTAPLTVVDGESVPVPMPPYTADTVIPDTGFECFLRDCNYLGQSWCGVPEHFRLKRKEVHTFLHEEGTKELHSKVNA